MFWINWLFCPQGRDVKVLLKEGLFLVIGRYGFTTNISHFTVICDFVNGSIPDLLNLFVDPLKEKMSFSLSFCANSWLLRRSAAQDISSGRSIFFHIWYFTPGGGRLPYQKDWVLIIPFSGWSGFCYLTLSWGSEWGGGSICRLSVKIFDLCRLSVNPS